MRPERAMARGLLHRERHGRALYLCELRPAYNSRETEMAPTRMRAGFHVGDLSSRVFLASLFLFACSSASPSSDGGTGGSTETGGQGGATGGTGGAAGGGHGGAGAAGQGGTACGSAAPCTTGQICVRPSCGGGAVVCEKLPDGGQCPSGWTYTSSCASGVGPGCLPAPCTSPPPFCADVPAACSGTPSCSCLPINLCQQNGGSGSCQFVTSAEVMCGSD
jgi:hypothetical protein